MLSLGSTAQRLFHSYPSLIRPEALRFVERSALSFCWARFFPSPRPQRLTLTLSTWSMVSVSRSSSSRLHAIVRRDLSSSQQYPAPPWYVGRLAFLRARPS